MHITLHRLKKIFIILILNKINKNRLLMGERKKGEEREINGKSGKFFLVVNKNMKLSNYPFNFQWFNDY